MHLPVFILGIVTYHYYKNSKTKNNFFEISIILFSISFLVRFSNRNNPFYIIIGGYFFSFFIYYLSSDDYIFSNLFSKNFLVKLGELSYPLFLFHIPISYFFTRFFNFNFENNQYLIYLFSTLIFSKLILILQKKATTFVRLSFCFL